MFTRRQIDKNEWGNDFEATNLCIQVGIQRLLYIINIRKDYTYYTQIHKNENKCTLYIILYKVGIKY